MKKKLSLVGVIFTLTLTGCFNKKNKEESTTEITSDTTTVSEESTEDTTISEEIEDKKDKTELSIFTKDKQIEYIKTVSNNGNFDNDEKMQMILNFYRKRQDDELPILENEENIRIEFPSDLPKDSKVNIIKTNVKQDGKGGTENVVENIVVDVNKNGDADIKHIFDKKDKHLDLIVYEVLVNWDDTLVKYDFAFKVDNRSIPSNKPFAITGYLSSEEQKIYDNYKKDKKIEVFKNLEPTKVIKYYTQAVMEKEYSIAYTLYKDYDAENMTEEKYIQNMKSLSEDIKEDYISNLKEAGNGKFIKEGEEKGYIEYQLQIQQGHPMAMDMIKDNNVWKVQYMPTQ